MKFNFRYKNRKFALNVEICDTVLSQARGLMFKKNSKPLLFIFKTAKKRTIHSFFCIPFAAVWFDRNKIIDVKVIKTWKFSIKPKEKYDKLLEIPSNNLAFGKFLDDTKGLKRKKTYNN